MKTTTKKHPCSYLYRIDIPSRAGQIGGSDIIEGQGAAKAYAAQFKDAKVTHIRHLRKAADAVKAFKPYMQKPVLLRAAPAKKGPAIDDAFVRGLTATVEAQQAEADDLANALWVVKHVDDGTEQQVFDDLRAAKMCAAYMEIEHGFPCRVERVA